jgi:hypothetical protein
MAENKPASLTLKALAEDIAALRAVWRSGSGKHEASHPRGNCYP